MPETILIVDDEESVRRTFQDWLRGSGLNCEVFAVADSEAALLLANQHSIDLAILDWNLGSGSDGLQLLEDLVEFHPDVVAILITGFAHQATPLEALRMGVRDYLDKNQDLNRETFLASVTRQLERIIPSKRQRQFSQSLFEFREAVEKVLPLVQSSATLNDPVPLPEAIRHLFRFLQRATGAVSGTLIARHVNRMGGETQVAYGSDGQALPSTPIPFARSLAATVVSMQEPCIINQFDDGSIGPIELQPFEQGRRNLVAAPMNVAPGTLVVLELYDKPTDFTDADRYIVTSAAEFGTELLRQALAERQSRRTLFDAVEAALQTSSRIAESLPGTREPKDETLPPQEVMDRLKAALSQSGNEVVDVDSSLKLASAVRLLAIRHGPVAVRHCIAWIESLRELLDGVTGALDG